MHTKPNIINSSYSFRETESEFVFGVNASGRHIKNNKKGNTRIQLASKWN